MSNIIDFLERLGTDAQFTRGSDVALEQALASAQIDPQVRDAILMRDQRRLETLLGANPNVCCMIIAPAREEEPEDDEKAPDEDEPDDERAVRLAAS